MDGPHTDTYEVETSLAELLARVEAGASVTITRGGQPVARLVPVERRKIRFGTLKGQIEMADDFDETPEWLLDAFEGKDNPDDPLTS